MHKLLMAATAVVALGTGVARAEDPVYHAAFQEAVAACQAAGYRMQRGTAVAMTQCVIQQTEARLTNHQQNADLRQAGYSNALAIMAQFDRGRLTQEQAKADLDTTTAEIATFQNLMNLSATLLQMGRPSLLPYGAYRLGP